VEQKMTKYTTQNSFKQAKQLVLKKRHWFASLPLAGGFIYPLAFLFY